MAGASKPKIACFFARVGDPRELELIEFYAQDIEILRRLGYQVRCVTSFRGLFKADLFFIWWWTWAFLPAALARLLGRPSVITGTFNAEAYPRRPWHQRMLIRFAVRAAGCNVIVSRNEKRMLERMFPGLRIAYGPHIVDTDEYCPGAEPRGEYVLTVASMVAGNAERKAIPEIIAAAKLYNQTVGPRRFVLAGRVDEQFRRMAHQDGGEEYIHFTGEISKEEKIKLLQGCLAYLQPSRFEGFGLAILEAMSCGAPVVSNRAGAIPEVTGDAALLIEGIEPRRMVAALERLAAEPELRAELGQRARRRAERLFGFARRTRVLDSIIRRLGRGR